MSAMSKTWDKNSMALPKESSVSVHEFWVDRFDFWGNLHV
jgi:hypothetical protein